MNDNLLTLLACFDTLKSFVDKSDLTQLEIICLCRFYLNESKALSIEQLSKLFDSSLSHTFNIIAQLKKKGYILNLSEFKRGTYQTTSKAKYLLKDIAIHLQSIF